MKTKICFKFMKQIDCSPLNINKIIDCIPPAYKLGHTQESMMFGLYPSKTYEVDFRDNEVAAEKFRMNLFELLGNELHIKITNY